MKQAAGGVASLLWLSVGSKGVCDAVPAFLHCTAMQVLHPDGGKCTAS